MARKRLRPFFASSMLFRPDAERLQEWLRDDRGLGADPGPVPDKPSRAKNTTTTGSMDASGAQAKAIAAAASARARVIILHRDPTNLGEEDFVKNSPALVAVLVPCFVANCGGRTDYDPANITPDSGVEAEADAGLEASPVADAAPGVDVVGPDAVPIDAGSTFCSGASKVEMAHGMFIEVPVSTGLIAMDCCEAFSIRFHGESAVGMDIEFMFKSMGPYPEGTIALGATTEPSAMAYPVGDTESQPAAVVGELQIETTDPQSSYRVRLCAEVVQPGELLDGTKLYADWVTVANWGWDNRLQLQLLSDTTVTAMEAMGAPIESLELGSSVLSLSQLVAYDWSEHTLVMNGYWSTAAGILGHLPPVGVNGLPFVLLVDGQRVYLGAFTTDVSSVLVPLPSISIDDPTPNRMTIREASMSGVDVRDDPRVEAVMGETGKLVP